MTNIDLSFPTCLSSESEPVPIDDTHSHRKRSDTLDSKTLFDTNDLYVEPSSFTSFVGAIDRNTGYDDDMDVDLADLDLNLVLDKGKGKARIDINEQVSDMSFSSPGAGPSTPFSFTLSSFPSSYATYASGSGSPSGSYGYGGDTFSIPLASSPDPTFPLSSLPPLDFTSAPVPSFPSNFHSGFNTEDLVPITSPLEAVKFPFSSNAELWSKETFSPSPIENHEEEPLLSETVPAPAPIPIAQSSASPPHHSAQQETLLHRTFSAVPTPRHGPAHPQPIRSRSLSSLSVSSTRSISSSLSTLRRKMSKGKLVRRILLKPRSKQAQPPEEEDVVDAAFARSLTGPSLSPIAVVNLPSSPVNVRRGKRSHSVPILGTSSISVDDSTTILPSKEETASWDLPSELTFEIFACLVILHQMDYTRYVTTGALPSTIKKKDEEKIKDLCSGEGLGSAIKELVRLSRISKQISSIILPSALFSNLPLSTISTSNTSSTSLVRLIRDNGGACLRNLEFPTDITSVMAGRMKLISVSSPTSPTYPCLTSISLEGCNSPGLSNGVLNGMLKSHRGLKKVNLRGLSNVDDVTCKDALAVLDKLTNLNLSCCKNVSGRGIRALSASSMRLKYLRIPGIGLASEEDGLEMCKALGRRMMGSLKVLEMAHLEHLTDAAVEALVDVSNNEEEEEESRNVIHLRAKDAGHGTSSTDTYTRRITPLKHISLSSCPLLTDLAAHYLAYAVPDLEFLELSGIGEAMVEDGVIALLNTIHGIRKIDLEGTSIGDGVLDCLSASEGKRAQKLEHLVLSGLTSISNTALLTLIQSAPLLRVLEIDSTRTSQTTIKEFIRLTRQRKLEGAECVAIDCRSVGEPFVRELGSKGDVRTRRGWRGWGSTELGYIDKGGVWEYDSSRVIFKCFWSWQAVDTLRLKLLEESGGSGTEGSGRGGRSKLRRGMNEWLRRSGSSGGEEEDGERGCVVM